MASNSDAPDLESSRRSLLTMIASTLNRYRSSNKADVKNMLMLIAAIGLLNSKDDSSMTIAAARRLVATGKSS